MAIANEIQRLQQAKADIKTAVNTQLGVESITTETIDDYADKIAAMPSPTTLEVGATTVRYDATHTENIASNDRIRIRGNDGNDYTIAQWNAMFVEAGYDRTQMAVEPIGLRVQAFDADEIYLFDRYTGRVYNPVGDSQGDAGYLQHSIYNNSLVTATGNGTDFTTNKAWSVTADGDEFVLYEANTKQSWRIKKDTGSKNCHVATETIMSDLTQSLWAQTEWMRHRMAISSGVSTTKVDGTMGEIQILNSSGAQAAVGEDMYFWIKNDSDVLTNTNILAKYNKNNKHTTNSAALTQTIADAIYARQIANGINMNDTGVNSTSKPILAPGSKGAEVIAVDGVWMIITPFISQQSSTTSTATNNMADSPAVYWAIDKGVSLPTDRLLWAMYVNKSIVNAAITYLNSREGRGLPVVPAGNYIWSAVRYSASYAWTVISNVGYLVVNNTFYRFFVVGASAS